MYSRLKLNNLTLCSLSKKLIEGKSLKWWHVCKPLVPCSHRKSHQGFRQAAVSTAALRENIHRVQQLLGSDSRGKLLKHICFASLCIDHWKDVLCVTSASGWALRSGPVPRWRRALAQACQRAGQPGIPGTYSGSSALLLLGAHV